MPAPSLRLALLLALLLAGCRSTYDAAYFRTMEALGREKREILVDRVDEARESQEEARDEFASALDAFSALTGFDGGELETLYRRLDDAYERSTERAEAVAERIDGVERVAEALFEEWERELDEYSDDRLRRASAEQLRQTRRRYEALLAAMHRAEASMQPVLDAFQDQVLFLKHNLNARAVAALEDTAGALETDVAALIAEMETAIAEAERFIDDMQGGP
ncbi:MAG: DUF2959 domain-containing protein [Rhodothermales bacterium]|nr:DUF2959 domain-containing protein [Rhodothermales bacterium]